ncbi:hypothetical protein FMUND_13793 [Fusarium mundagurra]|uniref:Uncharacterized protein n=1 Tax=Fusarium mundagurra TaxID=1567541 RepID=A0A8H6D3R0_9HYPO|nr:hypothetical protein FMUND_13793 [Fusarium mundagurra]
MRRNPKASPAPVVSFAQCNVRHFGGTREEKDLPQPPLRLSKRVPKFTKRAEESMKGGSWLATSLTPPRRRRRRSMRSKKILNASEWEEQAGALQGLMVFLWYFAVIGVSRKAIHMTSLDYFDLEQAPPSAVHKANVMQLLSANDDLAQLAGGRSLDDISNMPSDDRRAVLRKYLVNEDPITMQEPVAWSDQESIGRFLLLKRFLDNDRSRQHLLLEARRVFYEENSFIIPLDGFSRFLDDMLGDWEDTVAVEVLVRDLTIKVERQDCECGQLMEYIQRLSYFAKMPQLQKITVEWFTPTRNIDEALPCDWSTLSSGNSSKGTSLHSATDGDSTSENGGSNETLRWETSDDDIWSLDGDVHG